MSVQVGTQLSLQPTLASPSLGRMGVFLVARWQRVAKAFASLRSGTELVRDPFSPEQSRD
jgi:hypothetical protein